MALYKPLRRPGKPTKTVLEQGPGKPKGIKSWCHGRCLGIPADLSILTEVLLDACPHKRKWAEKLMKDVETSFYKLIKGLRRGHSS